MAAVEAGKVSSYGVEMYTNLRSAVSRGLCLTFWVLGEKNPIRVLEDCSLIYRNEEEDELPGVQNFQILE